MKNLSYAGIESLLQTRLNPQRLAHSRGVAEEARKLARLYQADEEQAYLAGLVHDYAKGLPDEELIRLTLKYHLYTDPCETEIPDVLHAPVGAFLLKRELDLQDEAVLQAVRRHTVGDEQMSRLDEIIYVADMIEPGRQQCDLSELRQLAYEDLSRAVLMAADCSLHYCLKQGRLIHPRSVLMHNSYIKKITQKS
jgi:predicted HD superfamily hydrolase involved in NAD metabolism